MSKAIAKYKALKSAADKAKSGMQKVAKEALGEMTAKFFAQNPSITGIGWTQYDRDDEYFSGFYVSKYPLLAFKAKDGRELRFNSNSGELACKGPLVLDGIEFEQDEDYDEKQEELYYKEAWKHCKAVELFLKSLGADDLENMFGGDVLITINRDGKVTTKDYYENS